MIPSIFARGRTRSSHVPLLAGLIFFSCVFYISHRSYRHRSERPRLAPPIHLPPRPAYNQPHLHLHKLWNSRAEEVKDAFLHAYKGYKRFAGKSDELRPVTNRGVNNFNGWGLTMVDGLDTLWMMGLYDEFHEALLDIGNMSFALDETSYAPFFETVIRYLGGLLSAYALSNETVLLNRADDLGRKLLPAFDTSIGLPSFGVNTMTGELDFGWSPGTVMFAEVMSCQMEYKYLAHLTGRSEYFEKVEKVTDVIKGMKLKGNMIPTRLNMDNGSPMNHQFSVGALADSAFEYMLKQWLLSSRVESKVLTLYLRSVSAILNNLLFLSPNRHLLYATDVDTSKNPPTPSRKFEHLTCFLPGLLILGVHTLPDYALTHREKELHAWAAEGLANTCWTLYKDNAAGLGPDEVEFHGTNFKFGVLDDKGEESVGYVPARRKKRTGLLQGRWMEHVKEWERAGKPGGLPPGVGDPRTHVLGMRDYASRAHAYYLRPEAVESFYLMWRMTGDMKWRERGWAVFQAINLRTRTPSGFASILTVEQIPSPRIDEMPSYFMAETLKYLYLLFREDDIVPLDQWVFNTEAHPFPMFEWTPQEKKRYNIH